MTTAIMEMSSGHNIFDNDKLPHLIWKGPMYREPEQINCKEDHKEIRTGID